MFSTILLAALSGVLQAPKTPHWPGLEELPRLIAKHDLGAPLEKLESTITALVKQQKGKALLPDIGDMIGHPLRAPAFAIGLTSRLDKAARARHTDLQSVLGEASALLHCKIEDPEPTEDVFEAKTWQARLAAAEDRLVYAADLIEQALAGVARHQRAALALDLQVLLDDFVHHIYVHEKRRNRHTFERVRGLDMAKLFAAARQLAPLADRRFYRALPAQILRGARPERAKLEGVEGPILLAKNTVLGPIIVGGRGKNHYRLPVALLVDLGGNDVYEGVTTHSDAGHPVNVVIDLGGNDVYKADGHFAQGCGLLGVSLLVDDRGEDRYVATRAGQGCGVFGIGILLDREGDDHYEGDAFVQGAGCFGLGCLIDLTGDDVMDTHIDSQGFAWPLSVGLLLDVRGKDRRTATGKYGSSYGTKGQFQGNSQGASFGFRTLACGGFGVLIDGGGDDVSKVGEFGHGCGYFLGCGIVRDFGGNDRVLASRYGIATGAHMGIGIVLDDAGNDFYQNPYTAGLAGNWDLTSSFLLDAKGDDHYVGAGITAGSATITSLAALIDGGGKDRYEIKGSQCFGNAGHVQDLKRHSRSMAFFLDLGGKKDIYPSSSLEPAPRNRLECVRRKTDHDKTRQGDSGIGLFLDR